MRFYRNVGQIARSLFQNIKAVAAYNPFVAGYDLGRVVALMEASAARWSDLEPAIKDLKAHTHSMLEARGEHTSPIF